jgi:hypothetical protein
LAEEHACAEAEPGRAEREVIEEESATSTRMMAVVSNRRTVAEDNLVEAHATLAGARSALVAGIAVYLPMVDTW